VIGAQRAGLRLEQSRTRQTLSRPDTDGSTPRNRLTLGSDGNFYGSTYFGGTHNDGTVFKLTPAGVLTTLHSFNGNDGNYPLGPLFEAANGTLYGTTTAGGCNGGGTIFSLDVGLK
jgi:uncharacterized repeat protein (TIGR03803 family)